MEMSTFLIVNIFMYGHIGQKETLRRHGENKRQGHKIGIDCVALPFLVRLLLSQEREGGLVLRTSCCANMAL